MCWHVPDAINIISGLSSAWIANIQVCAYVRLALRARMERVR